MSAYIKGLGLKKLLALAIAILLSSQAYAWNDKGHMVVARLAWNKLSPEQRAKVVAILKRHPHYDEFLAAKRPDGFPEDEWVFQRAATWADWVRNHHAAEFNHGPWHYINFPFVPPGCRLDPARYEPPPNQENVVNALANAVAKIRSGTDEEKAVALCWLFHLTGDIHQPLHCVAMYSELFPAGDQGGNLCRIRIRSGPVNLHSFWDGLLGTGLTYGAIGKDVREIEQLLEANPELAKDDLATYTTFESWGREGAALAKTAVYLNGELQVSKASSGRSRGSPAENAEVHEAPSEYAPKAGRLARVQIGKAGIRLADQLSKLFP